MRRGFSLMELLVASLLMGMLMTILTMIFSQSSIAWRTGIANLSDLDKVRMTTGRIRTEADNAYVWKNSQNEIASILPIWRYDVSDGTTVKNRLRKRAVTIYTTGGKNFDQVLEIEKLTELKQHVNVDKVSKMQGIDGKVSEFIKDYSLTAGEGKGVDSESAATYTVNVRSAGPDRKQSTYDDIWSYPDDFDL